MRAAVLVGWASLWLVTTAYADDRAARWTRVQIELEGAFSTELESALRADLEASLRADGFALTNSMEGREERSAIVRVRAPSDELRACAVRIEVAATGRVAERTIHLARVPRDAWSVAIAAGVSEFVHAVSRDSLPREGPVSVHGPPDLDTDEDVYDGSAGLEPETFVSALSIGMRSAYEFYSGGQMLVGADLHARLFVASRVALELSLGARLGVDMRTAVEPKQTSMLLVDIGPSARIIDFPSPVRLDAFILGRLGQVAFRAGPESVINGVVAMVRVGFRALVAFERSELGIELGLGVPLLGLEGVSGVEFRGGVTFFSELIP